MRYGILIDITKCIGCYACEDACAERWGNPQIDEHILSAFKNTAVEDHDGTYVPRMCMHCEDPTCVSVCPVGAFTKISFGPVVYDPSKCIGCRYCMQACPFDIPKYQWHSLNPKVTKCDMCFDRIKNGGIPACVEACPAEARIFGPREELVKEAKRRIQESPNEYYPHIFGLREAGGTSVIYLAPKSFKELGFRTNVPEYPLPHLTWEIMTKIPNFIFWGGALLFGIWWITKRRNEVPKLMRKLEEMEKRRKGNNSNSKQKSD